MDSQGLLCGSDNRPSVQLVNMQTDCRRTFPTATKYGMESKSFTLKSLSPLALTSSRVFMISARSLSWMRGFLANSQRQNVNYGIGYDGLQPDICENADRARRGFVACQHNCPTPWVSRSYLDGGLSYRTWAIISSSFSRHSGRRAELALTKQLGVTPCVRFRKGDTGRTEQTEEIPSRGTVLQLLSLLLDQLPRDFVRICPILPKFHHPRTLVSLGNPCGEALWGPSESVNDEYTFLGNHTKCSEAMRCHGHNSSCDWEGREPYARFEYDFVNLLSVPSKAPKSYPKAPSPILVPDQ